ncbi:N-6 DNA methylase [Natrononativus amylolyticus]|uniref:N-6 DNA methylase n=1 Tax=Natrononativus amylolyticus TaxID=2963434 RepID=UPI0020CFA6A4|nr:N-6 DNA methylase [Natrononativus amylolyticus]
MPDDPLDADFAKSLDGYLERIRRANSEASRGHQFLSFIGDTFSTLDSDQAHRMLPMLEEHVKFKQATVAISGRIDARLGNVLVEFKTNTDNFSDAKEQLKTYITAIWAEQGRDQSYYLVASDGITCEVYIPELAEEDEVTIENTDLRQVDEINLNSDDTDKVFTKLDRYLLFSEDLLPTAENIVLDFGPTSPICREGLELLHDEWESIEVNNVEILFDEWQRYLEIVHGSGSHSEALFIRHTYLSILAKLMAYVQYSGGVLPDDDEVSDVITGEVFERLGIQNFIEEDFFSWVSRESADGADKRIVEHLLARLHDYDLSEIEEDVLKTLYQDLVTPEERHSLGEYYTPDWLAEEMVNEELEDNPEASVLDPTCGSGTFLFSAIRYKMEHVDKDGQELIDHLFNNVVGIDVHPLAIITARVNVLLALGDLLREERTESVSVPVYLSNTIMPPEHERTTAAVDVYRFNSDEGVFELPITVTDDEEVLNELLDSVKSYLDSNDEIDEENLHAYLENQVGEKYEGLADDERGVIYRNVVERISDLRDRGRDTIWTFILKNVYKPIYFEEKKFDRVIGNPPWLSYRYISREEYKDHVKHLVTEEYGLLDSSATQNLTHMELASLVLAYSFDHYLEDGGRLSFVMPRGIFSGTHHKNFRSFDFSTVGHWTYLWDLEYVKPLFNNVSCVIAAEKSEGESYPLDGRIYQGSLPKANASLEAAREELDVRDITYYLNEFSESSVIMDRELDPDVIKSASPYKDKIENGGNAYPRTLWFVDFDEPPALGINPQEPPVHSSDRAVSQAGDRWEDAYIEGQIENEFLWNIVTGSEIAYFGTLEFPTAVLPLEISGSSYHLHDEESARRNGHQHLANWISEADRLFEQYKPEDRTEDVLEWLNWHQKFTDKQDPNAEYRVLQNSSGDYVCGAVVKTSDLTDLKVNGTIIELQRNSNDEIPLIVDHKCYHYETDSYEEAYYLSGFLNAPAIRDLIYDMINRGQFAGRDIHKRVWEVYIPEFNPNDPLHREISETALEATEQAAELIPELAEEYSLGWVRRKQREEMEPIRSELSELCVEALEEVNAKQSSLADHTN